MSTQKLLVEKIALPPTANKQLTKIFNDWLKFVDLTSEDLNLNTVDMVKVLEDKLKKMLTPVINNLLNSQIKTPFYGTPDNIKTNQPVATRVKYDKDNYQGTSIRVGVHIVEKMAHHGTATGFRRIFVGSSEEVTKKTGPYMNVALIDLYYPFKLIHQVNRAALLVPNWVGTVEHELTHIIQSQRSNNQHTLTSTDKHLIKSAGGSGDQEKYLSQQVEIEAHSQNIVSGLIWWAEDRGHPTDIIKQVLNNISTKGTLGLNKSFGIVQRFDKMKSVLLAPTDNPKFQKYKLQQWKRYQRLIYTKLMDYIENNSSE